MEPINLTDVEVPVPPSTAIIIGAWKLEQFPGEDEPRILDVTLGEKLGYSKPRDVVRVIEDLIKDGELQGIRRERRTAPSGNLRGSGDQTRDVLSYYLNEEETLDVIMASRTKTAYQIRHEVRDVYLSVRRGERPNLVTEDDSLVHVLAQATDARLARLTQDNADIRARADAAQRAADEAKAKADEAKAKTDQERADREAELERIRREIRFPPHATIAVDTPPLPFKIGTRAVLIKRSVAAHSLVIAKSLAQTTSRYTVGCIDLRCRALTNETMRQLASAVTGLDLMSNRNRDSNERSAALGQLPLSAFDALMGAIPEACQAAYMVLAEEVRMATIPPGFEKKHPRT